MHRFGSNNRWVNLWVSFVIVVGVSLPYLGWTPALSEISAALSLTFGQAGALTSATALAGGFAIFVGGGLVMRFGPKKVIVAALVIAIVGQILFSTATSFEVALAARAVSGVAVGLLYAGPYTLAIGWFHESRQVGRPAGILLSGDGVGTVLSLVVFAAVSTAVGWRSGLLIQSVYLGVMLVLALTFLKDPPAFDVAPVVDGTHQQESALSVFARVIRNRNVLCAIIMFIGGWGLFSLIGSWMPTILVTGAGWRPEVAGLFSSFFSLFGIITAVSAGLMSERFVGRRRRLIVLSGTVLTILVAIVTVSIATENYTLTVITLPLIGLAAYSGSPIATAMANESVDSEHVGAVTGLIMGSAFLVGGFVYPLLVGLIKDSTGSFSTGFLVVTGATFVLCVLAPLIARDSVAPAPVPERVGT